MNWDCSERPAGSRVLKPYLTPTVIDPPAWGAPSNWAWLNSDGWLDPPLDVVVSAAPRRSGSSSLLHDAATRPSARSGASQRSERVETMWWAARGSNPEPTD